MKYLPDNPYTYTIFYDSKLLELSRDLFSEAYFNNKFLKTKPAPDKNRGVFRITSTEMDPNKFFTVLPNLGIKPEQITEWKFEILYPSYLHDNFHLQSSRFNKVNTTLNPNPTILDDWGTLAWHTDYNTPVNNYKCIFYLNDIQKDQGGTWIADPIISPFERNGVQELFEDGSSIDADKITYSEVVGPAGTGYVMNSHLVHRAALPKHHYRIALHFGFTVENQKYHHRDYRQKEFYEEK